MASVFFHFNKQLKKNNKIKLFKGHSGYLNGEQKRDFVHVDDIVKINFWFFKKISQVFLTAVLAKQKLLIELQKILFNFMDRMLK